MELKVWSKTFLTVYKYLEKITDSIDSLIMNKSLNICSDAFAVANEILELTERKVILINLKVLVESALKKANASSSKLLILKFIDGVSCEDGAKLQNISLRSYFRHIDHAVSEFSLIIKSMGFDETYLNTHFKNEKWLFNLYNRLLNQEINRKNRSKEKSIDMQANILKLLCSAYGQPKNKVLMSFVR